MGAVTSRPLDSQVDGFILRCAELYERFLRWTSDLLVLFFVPLVTSPITITNYCSRARRRWANSSSTTSDPANSAAAQEKLPLTRTTSICPCHHQPRHHLHQSRRIHELQIQSHHDLKRVTSITSQRSNATTNTSAAPASPYSFAGMKASRETIERRRARAELAAAGFDVQQLRRQNSARTSSNNVTPISTTPPELPLSAPPAAPPPLKRRTTAAAAYAKKKTAAAALTHQRSSLPIRAKEKVNLDSTQHAFILTPGAQQPHLRLAPALAPSTPKAHKERKHQHNHGPEQHDQVDPLPETPVRRTSTRRRARAQGSYQGL